MALVQELFDTVEDYSERFVYLDSDLESNLCCPQRYDDIVSIISQIDRVDPANIKIKAGMVSDEERGLYNSAILAVISDDITYVFMKDLDTKENRSVLARITVKELSEQDRLFFKEDCDCTENGLLRENQIVIDGDLIESEYIAFCIEGIWYRYNNPEDGRSLKTKALNIKQDLVPIPSLVS